MKKRNLVLKFAALLLIAMIALSGCSANEEDESANGADTVASEEKNTEDSSSDASGNGELFEFKIADTTEPYELYVPYVADELGYFEEEGLKPVYTGVIPPAQQVPSVVAGTNDFGHMMANYIISAVAAEAPIKAVAENSQTTQDYPHMEFIALEETGIDEPKGILGKKIGVVAIGDCNDYTPLEYLRQTLDIDDPREQVEFIIVPMGNEESALREGEIDVLAYHGHPAAIFARGGVELLFTDYDVWGEEGGSAPWFSNTEFIEEHPEQVAGFVRAIAKANKYCDENVEESIALYAKHVDMPVDSITTKYFSPDGVIKDNRIQLWQDILLHYGNLETEVDLSKVYTNEFNDAN